LPGRENEPAWIWLSNSPKRLRRKKHAVTTKWKPSISSVYSVGRNWPTARLAVESAGKPEHEVTRFVSSSSMKNLALAPDVVARLPKATPRTVHPPPSLTTNPAKEIGVSPASAMLLSATFGTMDHVFELIHTPLIPTTIRFFKMPPCMHHHRR
jgi:hypothetical protein